MQECVIYDLDGTLINMPKKEWQGDEFNWDNFISWMNDQDVNVHVVHSLINHFVANKTVVIVTARPEKYRKETELLLDNNGIVYDTLVMRSWDLIEAEMESLSKCNTQKEIQGVLFEHHSKYRAEVAEKMKLFGFKPTDAYDDQSDNLDVWNDIIDCTNCWEVDSNGNLNKLNYV